MNYCVRNVEFLRFFFVQMSAAELRARASPTGVITQLTRRSDAKPDLASSDNNSLSGDEDPQDLSINSSNKYYNANQGTPLDFHHNSAVNNKIGSISSLLINSLLPSLAAGMDKENLDSS